MRLIKEEVKLDYADSIVATRIMIQEDVNVMDVNPDMKQMLTQKIYGQITSVEALDKKVEVNGLLCYEILYRADDTKDSICSMKGSIPFTEQIALDCVKAGDRVSAVAETEDIKVDMIHSRKCSVMVVLQLNLKPCDKKGMDIAVGVEENENIQCKQEKYQMTELVKNHKDIYRVKEEIELQQKYPNIKRIIWWDIQFLNVEFRAFEDKISLQGERKCFFLYESEDDTIECLDHVTPFSGTLECDGCGEHMITDIFYQMGNMQIDVIPDYDGENRVIALEGGLDLDISLYEEKELNILADLYGVNCEVECKRAQLELKNLAIKTQCRTKVNGKFVLSRQDAPIYQILYTKGIAKIDESHVEENGIAVHGTLLYEILYRTEDGQICALTRKLPYETKYENRDVTPMHFYKMDASVEQFMVSFADEQQWEIKAVICLKILVMECNTYSVLTGFEQKQMALNVRKALPSMTICVVGEGDTLWDLGKRYHIATENIRQMNDLDSDMVEVGQKLLLVR